MADDVVRSLEKRPPPLGGMRVGRADVLEAIRRSAERTDRRVDERAPRILEGPRGIPGGIPVTSAVTSRRDGLEFFVLLGEEWDLFRDARLSLHRESIPSMDAAFAYLARHSGSLLPATRALAGASGRDDSGDEACDAMLIGWIAQQVCRRRLASLERGGLDGVPQVFRRPPR